MAHSKFSVHGSAWEACTRSVIHPLHITEIPGQHVDAVVNFPQILPRVTRAATQETPESEDSLLNSVLELADDLPTYRDNLRYYYVGNPDPDCDVPEADEEPTEEDRPSLQATVVEENAEEEDQPSLQATVVEENAEEEDQPSLQATVVEENAEEKDQPSLQVTLVEENAEEEDQPSLQGTVVEENAEEEDQPSLQVTLVDSVKYKCQCGFSAAGDPSTRQLEVNVAVTFDCTYCKAGREASPIHMDFQVVQTVSASAEEGSESICSSRILMEVHLDQTAKSDSCERLSQAMKGEASSVDSKLEALHINPDDQLIKCSLTSQLVPEGEPPTTKINHALEEPPSQLHLMVAAQVL